MAKEKTLAVASMLPDEMAAGGGLPTDFDGVIINARLTPWDYGKEDMDHILAVRLTILNEDDGETVVAYYSAGQLKSFQPSMDGVEPVDLENGEGAALDGIYAVRVGKAEQLNNNSNWAVWLTTALEAGLPRDLIKPRVDCFEGVRGHWTRLPQPQRTGLKRKAEGDRIPEYLALTEYMGQVDAGTVAVTAKGAAVKTAAAEPKATAVKSAAPVDTGFADRVSEVVLNFVAEAGAEVHKSKLTSVLVKSFTNGQERAQALKLIADADYLGNIDGIVYDPGAGTLEIG